MGPYGLLETERFLGVDEHEAFMDQIEILRTKSDIDLFVGQTDMDLLSFLM